MARRGHRVRKALLKGAGSLPLVPEVVPVSTPGSGAQVHGTCLLNWGRGREEGRQGTERGKGGSPCYTQQPSLGSEMNKVAKERKRADAWGGGQRRKFLPGSNPP